jgi:hypothetical protein
MKCTGSWDIELDPCVNLCEKVGTFQTFASEIISE